MRLVNFSVIAMQVFNLALAIYILARLIIPLRIKGFFIIAFYVLSVILMLSRIIEVAEMYKDPEET